MCRVVSWTAWISPRLLTSKKAGFRLTKFAFIQTNISPTSIYSKKFYWNINIPTINSWILFFHCPSNTVDVIKSRPLQFNFNFHFESFCLQLCYNQSIICFTPMVICIFCLMFTWFFLFARLFSSHLCIKICHPVQLISNAVSFVKLKPSTRWDLTFILLKLGLSFSC